MTMDNPRPYKIFLFCVLLLYNAVWFSFDRNMGQLVAGLCLFPFCLTLGVQAHRRQERGYAIFYLAFGLFFLCLVLLGISHLV